MRGIMVAFHCLKLAQGTVEEWDCLPKQGERLEQLRRWPGKAFEVAEVTLDRTAHPLPMVLLRQLE